MNRYPKLTATLLGFLSAIGFVPIGWWPITLVCLALLIVLVRAAPTLKSALARGYWFGWGHFVVGLNWIAGAFHYQDAMPVWLGWVAVITLAFYIAVYPALAVGLAWRWGRDYPLRFALFFAAGWTVTEWLRASLFTGFAWNPLGVILVPTNVDLLARVIGTYGLSAIVILMAGLTLAIGQWLARSNIRNFSLTPKSGKGALIGIAVAVTAPLIISMLSGVELIPHKEPTGGLVRIVQPNIGQQDKHNDTFDAINFAKLTAMTGKPGKEPRLILWPEAATPDFLEEEIWARERIAALMGPKDAILTGGVALIFDKNDKLSAAHNSTFAMTPDARLIGRYDKSHLVPYGEYLPMRPILSAIGLSRLVPGDVDFLPGPGAQTIALPGFGKAGVQICYEIIFSGDVVSNDNRPDFLFNPSNDAWFGAWGPPQHLAQAQLRAIEEGVPVIRSTPTGISAVINASGKLIATLPYKQAGFIQTHLPLPRAPTLFALYGNILPLVFALFLALLGVAHRRKRR